ncbi:flagellar basal body-associated FliL family protein [Salicola sp. Rm-C-2C1-2]|uniref:flagellar basal body-associated FliL family protein n=1 Tax=Salicola sp. Rm-C-2C1-2 TaxID=3141321 RepID=UPI0032E4F3CE
MRQFIALLMILVSPLALAAGGGGDKGPPSTYLELSPAFVVNIGDKEQTRSYAKAQVTLRFHEAKARKKAEAHTPWLRHEVVMLMSDRSVEALRSSEGQKQLRADIRKAVSKRLVSEIPALAKTSEAGQADKEDKSQDKPEASGPLREVLLPDFIVQAR